MSDVELPDTEHFGFTRVGEGEGLEKAGFAALDRDRIALDDLLHALVNHEHTAAPRLRDPEEPPSLIALTEGGVLPANTTFYYRIAYVDAWGLETAASPEAIVTTAPALEPPQPPALSPEQTEGEVAAGTYSYVITFVTPAGGETTTSGRADVRVESGIENRVLVALPELPAGAVAVRIYRAKPGQTQYYLWLETIDEEVYDDGTVAEDQSVLAPSMNTTHSTNSVVVTLPEVLPDEAYGWRVYRSVEPGFYTGFNLVHEVVEGEEPDEPEVATAYTDTGDTLQIGEPRETSATVGGGRVVRLSQLAGQFPLASMPRGARSWATFIAGTPEFNTEYNRTRVDHDVIPTRIHAFFQEAVADGVTATLRVTDGQGEYIELSLEGGGQHFEKSFSRSAAGEREAEQGVRSNIEHVPIVSDPFAVNGQAVQLHAVNEYVQTYFGELDAGPYIGYVKFHVAPDSLAPEDDLVFMIVAGESGSVTVLNEVYLTGNDEALTYYEVELPFTAPGGEGINLRMMKATDAEAAYWVDRFRYEAILTTLAKGPLSLSLHQEGEPGPAALGADANVAVWF